MKVKTTLPPEKLEEAIEILASELGILDRYVPAHLQLMKANRRRPLDKVKFDSVLLEQLCDKFMDKVKEVVKRWRSMLEKYRQG